MTVSSAAAATLEGQEFDDTIRLSNRDLRPKNTSDAEQIRLGDRIAQLQHTIERIGRTAQGDNITLDYLPEFGTRLAVNGVSQGQAIVGADFFDALLGLFAGYKPVDSRLKKGLLRQ